MSNVSVYDPPQCCATGVCGPDADDELAQFASALNWLQKQGVDVARYNLGQQPGAFVENGTVKAALDSEGMDCLPMVLVDGEIVRKGGYMSRGELGEQLGLEVEEEAATVGASSGCCG